ncbi:MBL fold metallo-hydrolase [Tolypothrix sp. PCC 7910]|uniref:MBL fold metallo-hydrolase n=1 Tax=Tolypothrix sp. PCC 7910 TaxID=2099387 RepID=UPI0014278546|nr:MBL fold metallo-hydrolase [Tolypothrix sp. PCC 7910]QIR35967.1 MBL fold metallo-hydrolase [Tolypothrix sp. PCC 7910]
MTNITEIAPDIYRISTYDSNIDLQFLQFLVKDEEPLLFHTGLKKLFPQVRDAVNQIIDSSKIRWISFSHFEADECGSLNEWLSIAPNAQTVCTPVAAFVSVDDFAIRPSKTLQHTEVLNTGKYSFQFQHTPQLPHGWDAGLFFETTNKTLLCSDLFHQFGDVEAITESDVIERFRQTIANYEVSPFPNYIPYTTHTDRILQELVALKPRTLATMHGSTFVGDGERALQDLATVLHEELVTKQKKV